MSEINILNIIKKYSVYGDYVSHKPITDGHINDTFVVTLSKDGAQTKYLFQRINTNVFKKPREVMANVIGVTSHLKKKIIENGGDPNRETLTVFKTNDGENCCFDENNDCWRVYNFVDNSYSVNELNSAEDFKSAALSFGNFQKQLADYPIDTLYETIENFHNTVSRFADFKKAVEDNISGRKDQAKDEIEFAFKRESICSVVVDLLGTPQIPVRVTHNDTKLNNILFDKITNESLCVVDLDTVMPGSALYDFGDSIRSGANTGAEDEKDLSKISLSLDYFKAYVEGFLDSAGESLTQKEIELLPFSAKLLTFECGIRFLGDFLNGDTYFKTDYPEHNLVRTRTQFKLVEDIELKFDEMVSIVEEVKKSKNL